MKDREETHEQAQAEPEVCAETPGQVTSEKPAEVCAETPGQVTPEKPVEVSAQSPLIAQDQADYAQGDDQALSNALQGALSQAPAHSQSNACEAKQQA
eukprot:s1149_g19.t2